MSKKDKKEKSNSIGVIGGLLGFILFYKLLVNRPKKIFEQKKRYYLSL